MYPQTLNAISIVVLSVLPQFGHLDDIADVNKLFKKSNISKKLASKLLDDSKFADALDKPYTKTASAAKEASSAVEKVAEASTSTASAVAEVGAATATSSAYYGYNCQFIKRSKCN